MSIFTNYILISGIIAWGLAQLIKVPLEYLQTHEWNWSLLIGPGGMPSSHSALLIGITHATGLFEGYDSPLFALCVAVTMVVVYDATGIRRQAGKHAELINAMIRDLAAGHPLKESELKEVLGHTPLEVLGGIFLGLIIAQLVWWIAR
ncbi:MAG: divergent PAP2 family protein [Anaerolineales bacterium]|nr:divergent PAP2 family protein [Anaerolineales bacterium]